MAPEFDQTLRRWYVGQLIVLMVAVMVRLLITNQGMAFPGGGMVMIIWFLNALWPAIDADQHDWRRLRHFNYYVQTVLLFTLMPIMVANLINLVCQATTLDEQGLIAVGMAYLVVAFVPVGYVVTAKIQSVVGRIAVLISAIFSGLIGAQPTLFALPLLNVPATFSMVSDAGILGAVGFVITVGVLMVAWGFRLPAWRLNRRASRGLVGLIIIVGVVFSLWNAFSDGATWATTFTRWNFQLKNATWKMFLSGLEPGIAEEWLYRYAVLTILLTAFRHSRFQLLWSVGLSGGLFGLWHFTNVLAGQSWQATGEQMIFAATLGWFLAVVYLYTGSITASMAIHAAIDILSMMASGSQTMTVPDAFEWQTIGLTVVVFVALTIFFLTGRRRRVMQAYVDQRLLRSLD
ncbi:CPBP family intramembrane metalloprotease [Lactiplantibacillus garii]|uniref:CPBP family intramembrane metalloprotease n=2 Tax=Lactiplantibacillus garii TaxID=2306423 RepID=A0A426D9W5_9LACO|nr:CPBP family intramembrane metalloprotease [Lactiplantibacillus garii]